MEFWILNRLTVTGIIAELRMGLYRTVGYSWKLQRAHKKRRLERDCHWQAARPPLCSYCFCLPALPQQGKTVLVYCRLLYSSFMFIFFLKSLQCKPNVRKWITAERESGMHERQQSSVYLKTSIILRRNIRGDANCARPIIRALRIVHMHWTADFGFWLIDKRDFWLLTSGLFSLFFYHSFLTQKLTENGIG